MGHIVNSYESVYHFRYILGTRNVSYDSSELPFNNYYVFLLPAYLSVLYIFNSSLLSVFTVLEDTINSNVASDTKGTNA